jgi:hypothetical protein
MPQFGAAGNVYCRIAAMQQALSRPKTRRHRDGFAVLDYTGRRATIGRPAGRREKKAILMATSTLSSLTPRHLELFGTIVQWFARYELLLQGIMAAVAGTDPAAVMLLTRRLDFAEKRRVLLDLLRHRPIPMDQFDRIRGFLFIPDSLTPLCDNITHSSWKPGASASGVQPNWVLRIPPSVRPSHGDPQTLGAYVEDNQDRMEYTLEDLATVVENLKGNYDLFLAYVHDVKLMPQRP